MADANYPPELLYHPEHAWAAISDGIATVGISWFAQDALGEVVFFDPAPLAAILEAGSSCGELESLKAVSEVVAPLSGELIEINAAVEQQVELINGDPYGAGWLLRIRCSVAEQEQSLLSAEAYQALLA